MSSPTGPTIERGSDVIALLLNASLIAFGVVMVTMSFGIDDGARRSP